jgi:hypothetical protein
MIIFDRSCGPLETVLALNEWAKDQNIELVFVRDREDADEVLDRCLKLIPGDPDPKKRRLLPNS